VADAPAGRVVVLSPHLDDAVLSAWSVLCGPNDVRVINVCTGLPASDLLSPWDRLTGATESRTRMLERLQEDRVALARAGRHATSLEFPETQYRQGPLQSEALHDALQQTVEGAAHDDHVQIRNAALELAGNGGPPLKLYADLPYAVKYGWPGWVTAESDDPHLVVEAWWRRFLPPELDLQAAKHALSAAAARRKLHALAAYRTQLPGLNGGPLELLQRTRIIRYEVSWSVPGGAG
jgi:LmbE family N-acetylglucosaminyl deacetylase